MRRGSAILLVVLFATTFLPVIPTEHADGCACPPASCRCDHAGADVCGVTAAGSNCAMDACDKSAGTMALPAVILPDVRGLSLPWPESSKLASRSRAVERPREISDPPPRPVAC